ncbi:MAG: cytochrome c biogenesis protein CcsA [Candidatus Aminicenantes bacterium]|jgi:ABC-type transport system involved in cytochrome c biogenesis permease subunit
MNNTDQSKTSSKNTIITILKSLASLKLTVVCLVVLAVLVVWGTVYQAEHGLYQAQQKFFYSWFFFIFGFIPFPGTVLVMFVLFFNLVFSLFSRIGFRLSKIGNVITHLGIIILLVGGFFTFYFSEESSLMLKEGESSNLSSSRHSWELAIWQDGAGERQVYAVDADGFDPGETLWFEDLHLELVIKEYYENCSAFFGQASTVGSSEPVINSSGIQLLKEKPPALEIAENICGVVFAVNPSAGNQQTLLLYGQDQAPTSITIAGRRFSFSLRKKKMMLPLNITLKDFKMKMYPNSNIPKSYESHVTIKAEGSVDRDVVISMNKPLRFKDWTFFQSSYYIAPEGSEYTILAVVKNAGRLLPYYSSVTIFLGLVIHFLVMLFKRRKTNPKPQKNTKIASWLMLMMIPGLLAFAGSGMLHGEVNSLEHLRRMVILEHGRKKPLDTFAQNMLKQFSGQSTFKKKPAIVWLARVLFTPEQGNDDKIFLVTNPEVLDSIGVTREGKARDRYSFSQLKPGLARLRQLAIKVSRMEDKDRSFVENEIISLYNKLYVYQQLQASFDFLLPNRAFSFTNSEILEILGLPKDQQFFSFFDLAEKKARLQAVLASLQEKEQGEWSEAEKEIVSLSRRLENWAKFYGELPLAIIPFYSQEEGEEKWHSPWDLASPIILEKESTIPQALYLMRDFQSAYVNNDQQGFDTALMKFNQWVLDRANGRIRSKAISREVFLNQLDPFYKAKFFYGFAVLFLLLSFLVLKKWLYRFAFLLIILGFLLHLYGILSRMYIRLRPPVTNLYETFLFTGLIAVLLGIILELFKKKNIGIATGGAAGLVMLMIAGKYALEGDTMGMLVAVLDSNFWLASHVITIILGYAGIVLSGFIGHVYIVQRIAWPSKKDLLKNTFQAVYAIQAFGIIFTFLGTVLGGIWADQSWGRFWGWDPKENGALLILLWSAILFHGRLARMIKEIGFAVGSVIGVIAVALAWFGVNLLGVGLHSYGFTSGIAKALFIFIAFELLFVVVTLLFLKSGKERGILSVQ